MAFWQKVDFHQIGWLFGILSKKVHLGASRWHFLVMVKKTKLVYFLNLHLTVPEAKFKSIYSNFAYPVNEPYCTVLFSKLSSLIVPINPLHSKVVSRPAGLNDLTWAAGSWIGERCSLNGNLNAVLLFKQIYVNSKMLLLIAIFYI